MHHFRSLLWPRLQGQVNRWKRASRAERVTLVVFAALGLLFWAGLFGLFGWLVSTFHGVEVFGPIISRKLLELVMVSLFGLLCFSNVVTALSTFYISDDLELVLSLPVSRETFHFSRLADTLAQSSWMIALFGLPIFVAYGVAFEAGWTYVAMVALAVPAFVLIAAAVGVGTASLLVRVFPARRLREAVVLTGLLSLGVAFVILRLVRPERLLDADSFESVAAYVAAVDSPVPLLAPPRWASEVLIASLMERPLPGLELGLLLTAAVGTTGVARWITASVYDEGRAKAQEAKAARLAKAGWLDRALELFTRPLAPVAREIVIKDVKVFARDPSQWTQVFLVMAIVAIVLASVAAFPVDIVRGPYSEPWRNGLAYMVFILVGFVMAAVSARFQFTAVSSEGRAFWVVRTGPITAEQFLWAKVWPTLGPMVLVGLVLGVSSTRILGAGPFLVAMSAGTAVFLGFGISGVAVGLGARFADFKADNAARVAQGPAGLFFMVAASSLVFAVVALEALPTWIILRSIFRETALGSRDLLGIGVPLAVAAVLCIGIGMGALRSGARSLWARELPNG